MITNQIMDGNLEKEILNYFNDTIYNCHLRVLNNKYLKGYSGVSLNYITYDLLKAKYSKRNVAKTLLNLHKNGNIKSIYCKDINKYVFESLNTTHWNFNKITGEHPYSKGNVHKFLNKIINNEN